MKWKNKCFTCKYWDNHDYCNFMPISFCLKDDCVGVDMSSNPFKKTCGDYIIIDNSEYNDRVRYLDFLNTQYPYGRYE